MVGVLPQNFLTQWSMQIGSAALVMLLSLGLADVINTMRNELAIYNTELESLVDKRTKELRNTLEQVQTLKTQQDGDYFLTSLLAQPLGANNTSGELVDVQFNVKQKKQFKFKKWEAEIGGDICIAHSVSIKERPCTVFLNADAMGKSIQGAGGALVLGAVFQAIIERTKLSLDTRNLFPERWLKNAFIELQKVFESFDGTMLISMVLGLVDDISGLMYFINAEHPYTILYREKNASFIEDELVLHKLGIRSLEEKIFVKTFQLQPNDVVFLGSDGRDDILLGQDEEGSRIVNEDETLFLRIVEEGDGQSDKICATLLEQGELTDDFSLLRISYREKEVALDKPLDDELQALLRESKNHRRNGDYKSALEILEKKQFAC